MIFGFGQESEYVTVWGQIQSDYPCNNNNLCHYSFTYGDGSSENFFVDSNGGFNIRIKKVEAEKGILVELRQDIKTCINPACPEEQIGPYKVFTGNLKINSKELLAKDTINRTIYLKQKENPTTAPYFVVEKESIKVDQKHQYSYEKAICIIATLMICEQVSLVVFAVYDSTITENREMVIMGAEKIKADLILKGVSPDRLSTSCNTYYKSEYYIEKNYITFQITSINNEN
ncbi:MAG: hypothetical protein A2W91_19965 [Bacteroidetes bacterium GWF2_38_335]|nr:MAG: hypothetical protein A2W91_19965 [Bacteroidetes bacterium GWF2_38_335]OFY82003.1 MAG: hypothetical protein A2281_09955 [Bacteroidetes bacterium RIFOXYA12_FULL_38_20]HBS86496.1 hypothetical protein [Bacteroidales bacterium]